MVLGRTRVHRAAASRSGGRLFAEQLDDTLQLHGQRPARRATACRRRSTAVAAEAESPTAEEFARLLNKHRIGYDLAQAIEECADRMHCDDLAWTAQAVGIHREVGGNLGEVLDHVGETIRERNQIRRQVRTLSAEGRISANVLIALPLAIAARARVRLAELRLVVRDDPDRAGADRHLARAVHRRRALAARHRPDQVLGGGPCPS